MDNVSRDDMELAGLNARLASELDAYSKAEAQALANPLLAQEETARASLKQHRENAYSQVMNTGLHGSGRSAGEDKFDFLVRMSGVHDAYNKESVIVPGSDDKVVSAEWLRGTQAPPATRYLTSGSRPGMAGDPTSSGLSRANDVIQETMQQRHGKIQATPGVQDSATRAIGLENDLFHTRSENEISHGQSVRDASAAGQPRPNRIQAITTPSEKLTDALMSKPMDEIRQQLSGGLEDGNGKTINFTTGSGQKTLANTSVKEYAQALAKVEAIDSLKDGVESKRSSAAQTQAEIAKRILARGDQDSAIPQFNSENAEHYSKLNPADPKDRATLLQASQVMSDPRAISNGTAREQLYGAPRASGNEESARQGSSLPESHAATKAPTPAKQADGERQQLASAAAPKSKTGRPEPSLEEVQRRQRQFQFIEARVLAGSGPEQAIRDFREQEQARAQQTTQQQKTNQQARKPSGRTMG
jgi:hypothetical protein